MTYIAALDPNSTRNVALDAYVDQFDALMPDWQEREAYGDRYLTETDFPVAPAEVVHLPTTEDWEAFREANWSDPAEIGY